ncbi:6850_t:CDS:2 [Acaulospora colombiana]|uniref:6850_t:CDS:1 n=1 Tax=Acaulospora colombiana TaxID=27376 RepID=A0ACA9KU29_9GLOM|nr:6850_t:CDS:2 [Acaulospora colombiana]
MSLADCLFIGLNKMKWKVVTKTSCSKVTKKKTLFYKKQHQAIVTTVRLLMSPLSENDTFLCVNLALS